MGGCASTLCPGIFTPSLPDLHINADGNLASVDGRHVFGRVERGGIGDDIVAGRARLPRQRLNEGPAQGGPFPVRASRQGGFSNGEFSASRSQQGTFGPHRNNQSEFGFGQH
jgi:hypothetical protein